jgi:hypothetical protein
MPALKAIESLVKTNATLALYSVNNITTGTDAQGEVTVSLDKAGRIVNGLGADTDIVIASAKAYINAVNKLQQCLNSGSIRKKRTFKSLERPATASVVVPRLLIMRNPHPNRVWRR